MSSLIQGSGEQRNSILAGARAAMQRMESVGGRARKRREELGLKVKDVAKAAGMTPQGLSELESGRTKTSKNLHRLAAALDCSVEYLAGDDTKPPVKRLYGPLDVSLLTACIEELEAQLGSRTMPAAIKAETIASLYEAESKTARAAILRLVRRIA
jgi:transcriptional regulator with XRE-family HTH domain